jgi:hypothetical protein
LYIKTEKNNICVIEIGDFADPAVRYLVFPGVANVVKIEER